jgi:rSAM/selenodomain-associated transferase 1
MERHDTLILMGKAPVPGTVKTRLCPPLSAREAAAFYTCLLEDTAEEAGRLRGVRRYIFFAPAEGEAYFRAGPFSAFHLHPQAGSHLGERMERATLVAFAGGARRVVVIGADCPALSGDLIRSAFRELSNDAGAVFGPAKDGGYYLVGVGEPAPFLFRGIEWGAPTVLAKSLSRCRDAGIPYALLPGKSDVDTAQDLVSLRRWARAHARPPCPRTRLWLRDHLPALTSSGRGVS